MATPLAEYAREKVGPRSKEDPLPALLIVEALLREGEIEAATPFLFRHHSYALKGRVQDREKVLHRGIALCALSRHFLLSRDQQAWDMHRELLRQAATSLRPWLFGSQDSLLDDRSRHWARAGLHQCSQAARIAEPKKGASLLARLGNSPDLMAGPSYEELLQLECRVMARDSLDFPLRDAILQLRKDKTPRP